ncbi:hypothetical protein PanWU01x14_327310 [Parasponia andersonii]|uniref:Aspartic peptidase domain containing protein n=1 Tax=Parasponia andersonii TaxID=3476 RepID=A0A2P5AJ28_PARAD|nr:hypothetical protein PanWU01x14_327310 [Parasponia andersonii]
MLDTEATNNFVSEQLGGNLSLTIARSSSKIKTVNSGAQPTQGTATSSLKIRNWENDCSFMIVHLDDFNLILGIEFFVQAKAIVMTYLGGGLHYAQKVLKICSSRI